MKTSNILPDIDNSNMKSEDGEDKQEQELVTCSGKEFGLLDEDGGLDVDEMMGDEDNNKPIDDNDDGNGSSSPTNVCSSHNSRDPPVFSSAYTSGNLSNNLQVFKCSDCSYETYNLATLTSHQKIHKLYQCDICQMKFSHAANMRRHRMRHTGFKPFECRVCLKRFFRKDHLMEHMITHSKQLPFQCPMCDKSFNRQVYFKAHLQTDHWNLPSDKICSICGHKAATIKGAKLHFTTRHAKAANTVNSCSPANSRSLAEGTTPVSRSSLMSARLERGPTLVKGEQNSPSRSDGDSFSSQNQATSPIDSTGSQSSVSSSQLLFPPPLLTDSLSNFVMPMTVNSLNDSGGTASVSYPSDGMDVASSSSSRTHMLTPSRASRSLLSNSITLHRIGSSRHGMGNWGSRFARSNKAYSEPVTVKMEPPDDFSIDNNSSEVSDEDHAILPDKSSECLSPRFKMDETPTHLAMMASTSHSHSETCSPNSTLDLVRSHGNGPCSPSAGSSTTAAASFASATTLHRQVSVGDVTITPLGGALVCVHCGIVFPDQTLYFLHKGVHSENNPWKCNICGEPCRDKYDFNTHILSKAHQ